MVTPETRNANFLCRQPNLFRAQPGRMLSQIVSESLFIHSRTTPSLGSPLGISSLPSPPESEHRSTGRIQSKLDKVIEENNGLRLQIKELQEQLEQTDRSPPLAEQDAAPLESKRRNDSFNTAHEVGFDHIVPMLY